ncbi:MAG: hypothetical protein V3T84_06505 [Phycisphaerales bacterium]
MMMHEERESAVVLSRPPVNYDHAEPFEDGSARSLWAVVDNRLRGRWRSALITGVILGTLLGVAAYFSTVPKYQSAGLIRIAPMISPILRATPETGLLPMYQNFVQTQARLLLSRRVLAKALEDDTLSSLAWAQQPGVLRVLKRQLQVEAKRGTELIEVRFDADSPDVAQVVVNAVIKSYDDIYGSGRDGAAKTLRTLRLREGDLKRQRVDMRNQIKELVRDAEYGAGDLGRLLDSKYARLGQIEYDIEAVEEVLSLTPSPTQTAEPRAPAVSGTVAHHLDAFDPQLADLRQWRNGLRIRFEQAKVRWKPTYQAYIRLERELQEFEQLVVEREKIALAEWETAREQGLVDAPIIGAARSRKELERELQRLSEKADVCRTQIRQVVTEQNALESFRAEADDIKSDLGEVAERIKYLEIEQQSGRTGRSMIAALGERPVAPSSDRRRKLAAVGAVSGFALTFGLFFFVSAIDRRAYASAQITDRRTGLRCLGVLPDLARGVVDEQSCAVAAHCAHQIRNHIEAMRDRNASFVLAVSSPYQGDGKTSIVLALGWSYASAGHRTVLVDCDISGQSLTSQLGYSGQQGLKEVLRSGRVDGEFVSLTVPNLSFLPAGASATYGPEAIRQDDLDELFAQLRAKFDVILVDTGPLPGSLEALPVASAADAVLLSVRRGRRRSRLEDCIKDLETVGTACFGVVLNYAASSDCDRYVSGSSLTRARAARDHEDADSAGAGNNVTLGASISRENALVRAMESASRHHWPDD